jgi:hypothetical protein
MADLFLHGRVARPDRKLAAPERVGEAELRETIECALDLAGERSRFVGSRHGYLIK